MLRRQINDVFMMGRRTLKLNTPFLIGIAGGAASGKTAVVNKIVDGLTNRMMDSAPRIAVIQMESFFRKLNPDECKKAAKGEINLEHPDFIDENELINVIRKIMNDELVELPLFDVKTFTHSSENVQIIEPPIDIVILEGVLAFYSPTVRSFLDLRLFVDSDADLRLARRVSRDMHLYGRTLDYILDYHARYVKPAFEDYCLPTKKYAHIIIPRGSDNLVAIDLIVQHLQELLQTRSTNRDEESVSDGESIEIYSMH